MTPAMRVAVTALALVGLAGCKETLGDRPDVGAFDVGAPDTSTPDAARAEDAFVMDGSLLDAGAEAGEDTGPPLPPARACRWESGTFGAGMRELDTGPGGAPLVFDVAGLPAPALVSDAVLTFASHDADHPGEEGIIRINGAGDLDLPAMASWDNMDAAGRVPFDAALLAAGANRITFGPGPLPRSFFRIGDVAIEAMARVTDCVAPPDLPDPTAVRRTMHFSEASYTNRRTWVVPCPPGHASHNPLRNYAFTASGDEHEPTDCDGGYRAGGDRRGTAVFVFEDVARARYRVIIRSRHTENRNPAGALFVVQGDGRRIDQTTSSDYEDDVWGEADLEGRVEIVLDSTREGNSDSVTAVTIDPL